MGYDRVMGILLHATVLFVFIAIVCTVLVNAIRQLQVDRANPRDQIPAWDRLIQIVVFILVMTAFGWLLLPPRTW